MKSYMGMVLLSVGFFGGAVGALLGMKLFRHKTKHWKFNTYSLTREQAEYLAAAFVDIAEENGLRIA